MAVCPSTPAHWESFFLGVAWGRVRETPSRVQWLLLVLYSRVSAGGAQDHTRCWERNQGRPHARPVPYPCAVSLALGLLVSAAPDVLSPFSLQEGVEALVTCPQGCFSSKSDRREQAETW